VVRDTRMAPDVARNEKASRWQRRRSRRLRYHALVAIIVALMALPVLAGEQSLPYPRDPQTGRAMGATEMAAAELKKKIDAGEPVLVIEVRDASFYEKETIPGPFISRSPTSRRPCRRSPRTARSCSREAEGP
jgi:hypothetical protein